ncbi:MAG: bifunctional diguanylate cyclase/phosphodiesterase [Lachnospiraceae bacterium]|nr:bifunctional diguanylate cyclase/phosphodiesterase [Lachnospiraceae bacterium]
MDLVTDSFELSSSNINGMLSSLISFICILMVLIAHKKGLISAYIFQALNIGFMTTEIIRHHNISTLPGIFNGIVSVVSVTLIYIQLTRSTKMAITDYMTGLMNRRGLVKYIDNKVLDKNQLFLIYLELDNFRVINDNLGHKYGDMILRIVAKRLKNYAGRDVFVSRIGGAEFAVLINSKNDPKEFAGKLVDNLGKNISIKAGDESITINITVYAGISEYPANALEADELLKFADIAIYHARKSKTKKVLFFDKKMKDELSRQIELEKTVKDAIEKNWFYLVYQPQYTLKDKRLRGFETLLRLRLPDGTMISPGEFIPAVEKSEEILEVDQYVLKSALEEGKNLMNTSGRDDILISVNISAKTISSEDFVEKLQKIIFSTGFPTNNLELEITEYSLSDSKAVTANNIKTLRSIGVKIALDDFGTGYTSLGQVLELPIDLLKIDKSLIDDIYEKPVNRDFVDAVIYMGHLMKCEVISEGVESDEQLNFLRDHECDFVQGYIWGKPVPFYDALEICKNT